VRRPDISYLICSTPRTGSSLLCDALTATGIAGRPEEYFQFRARTGQPRRPQEYFEQAADEEIFTILGPHTRVDADEERYDPSRFRRYEHYLAWAIREGTTPNGVFGAKVMWGYFSGFVTGLRWAIPGCLRLDVSELVPSVLPNLQMLFMTRNDKVGQAVSLWRAIQSWSWSSDQESHLQDSHLQYSYPAIRYLLSDIVAHEDEWKRYFGECGVVPYVVEYEQLRDSYAETVSGILDHLRIPGRAGVSIAPPTRRTQADELSAEWVERYRAPAAADQFVPA
jgi:trehalose 2-sulfotransferase